MLQDSPDLGRADLERLHDMEGAGAWRKGKTRARRKKSDLVHFNFFYKN